MTPRERPELTACGLFLIARVSKRQNVSSFRFPSRAVRRSTFMRSVVCPGPGPLHSHSWIGKFVAIHGPLRVMLNAFIFRYEVPRNPALQL